MSTAAEHDSREGCLRATSQHISVMTSMDRTASGHTRPRTLRDVDELHSYVQMFPYMPRRREASTVGPPSRSPNPPRAPLGAAASTSSYEAGPNLFDVIRSGAASLTIHPPRSTTECGEPPYLWIDLKAPTRPEWNEVLSWLPLHSRTLQRLSHPSDKMFHEVDDRLEYFPAQGYTFLSLTGPPPARTGEYPAVILFILWDYVLVTMSNRGYPAAQSVTLSAVAAVNKPDGGGCSTSSRTIKGSSPGIATIFSALVSSLILQAQGSVAGLLMDVDQLDELVMQIQPSEMDQSDMLTRIKELRHRVARHHTCLLRKERVLKQLLLPALRSTMVCRDYGCTERYQRSLTLARGSVERLRKARDTVNLSCMNFVSGVSAQLVQHCHWMDYLNNVQGQISLVVMPAAVIPGLWASNVQVPFQNSTTTKAFWILSGITLFFLAVGLIYPIRRYFLYKPPGALVSIS